MELTMIKLKVLSTVAAIALVLPMAVPTASSAQHFRGGRAGVAVGGGGPAPAARFSAGGAPAARWSGATTGTRFSTGPTFTRIAAATEAGTAATVIATAGSSPA